jgi:hypothetical protein
MAITITISPIELLAMKKLVIINTALAQTIGGKPGGREQAALTRALSDVVNRAEASRPNTPPTLQTRTEIADGSGFTDKWSR